MSDLFDATPSRRMLMRLLATSAAVLPAVSAAIAKTEVSEAVPSTPSALTKIGELGAERERVMQESKIMLTPIRELRDELERLMPKPHPSIVFSTDNDADGLKYSARGHSPHTVHHYIYSNLIEEKLKNIEPTNIESITVDGCQALVVRNEPMPLLSAKVALKERLTSHLALSKKYERKIKRVKSKIGLIAANKKLEKLTKQQLALEDQIMSARCTTRSDFAAKLAIYDFHGRDGVDAESIIRDFRDSIEAIASATPADFAV
jgi:hypothetical protein